MTTHPRAIKRHTIVDRFPSGNVSRVGYQARIIMSDGTEVVCDHDRDHPTPESFKRCADPLFKRLAKDAGA